MRDLQGDDPIDLRAKAYEEGVLWVQERPGGRTGFWLPEIEGEEELVQYLADQLQEQVFPESYGAWGQARPPCPGHAHPASAELVGDHAMWICPSSGQPLARIGYLHEEKRECP